MRFLSYRPRRLPGLVSEIWEQRSDGPGGWRILPSGWVELLFRLGPSFRLQRARMLAADDATIGGTCFLSGLHTGPLDAAFDRFHMFGVQLHPVAVPAFFGLPCSEVVDGAVDAGCILDDLARLEDGVRAAPDFAARARFVEAELEGRLAAGDRWPMARAMRRLSTELPLGGPDPGRRLLARLGYSRSHAHRLFREWFGQSASDTIRITRFVRAVHGLHDGSVPLSRVAQQVGYYDQAHFTREFRRFSDLTPGEYRRRRGPAPGQLALDGTSVQDGEAAPDR